MIVVKLVGGLASQLHKYAIGRALAEKAGTELYLDITAFKQPAAGETPREYELGHFNIKARIASEKEIAASKGLAAKLAFTTAQLLPSGPRPTVSNLVERAARKILGHTICSGDIFAGDTLAYFRQIDTSHDIYVTGEWGAGFAFFENIRSSLLNEFQLKETSPATNALKTAIHQAQPSVSLHVRRGDYVSNPGAAAFHGVCSREYYSDAVAHILQRFPAAGFFVFSDDLAWVKQEFRHFLPETTRYAEGFTSYEDFHLLSQCQHNIISNSGFSALSAWANQNPEKIVISPKKWVNDEKVNQALLSQLPQHWTYI